ncbi:DinB family protein [Polluticoccus soli]|uniref:DinB family protein n=1 Tax=Polluticoccus soli TaxID=3034150 RepID=UPI0023E13672|nr:DinB family protein [Flavipsychrobacter sp. JY13-12]
MPVFNTTELLKKLTVDVQQIMKTTENIRGLDSAILNRQPATGKWSVAQVVEHLNSYNRYYLPEMEKALNDGIAKRMLFVPRFKSGWFGNYFTNMMLPKADGKIANKMNAPTDHVPAADLDAEKVIAEFVAGQQKMLQLLQASAKTDIGKLKVPISISRFIKLKLGDTFRFVIAHQKRHFVQLAKTLDAVQNDRAKAVA